MNGQVTGVTVLKDKSLGGVSREYREVKRKANVGERIKIVAAAWNTDYANGDVFTALEVDTDNDVFFTDNVGDRECAFYREYVVLEPTDVIELKPGRGIRDRFRMVDRMAAVGERMIVTKVRAGYGIFSAGNVGIAQEEAGLFDFNGLGNVNYNDGDGVWYVGPHNGESEYAVLEPLTSAELAPTPTPLSERPLADQYAENITVLTRKIAQLEEGAKTLEKRILALETDSSPAYVKVASGPVDTALPTFAKCVAQGVVDAINDPEGTALRLRAERKTPQIIRDEIVERAKADVIKLAAGRRVTHVEYVVNRKKRTVAALIVANASRRVITRGIAKCAPGETFNAHIGRAIALYRALGGEVPAEYLTCPQPETVRVGDVVTTNIVAPDSFPVSTPSSARAVTRQLAVCEAQIIDDSREDGGDSAASSALKGAA